MNSSMFAVGDKRLLVLAAVVFSVALVYGQEIDIRVLDGRNGQPITKECVNVWTGTGHGAHLVAATNKDGVAVLRVNESDILTEATCPGWPARASRVPGADGIIVSGDRYVACQEYAKIVPGEPPTNPLTTMPSYPIKKILESGVSAANTCGKFRAEAKPGELVFYARPRRFWEKMRQ